MHKQQTVGIWGFNRVGTAAARYYVQQGIRPGVFDAHPLSPEQQRYCEQQQLAVWSPDQLLPFLEQHELILPSPGIDLRPYHAYASKWVSEFDIFCRDYKKPVIAITGSVGKTSITHLLSQLLTKAYGTIATGGNIGIGMLDLLPAEHTALALLELSSFQLELVQTAAPDLAIITNIYPNHLDRHATLQAYTQAKARIFQHQTTAQKLLLPYNLAGDMYAHYKPQAQLYLFSDTPPTDLLQLPHQSAGIFFIQDNVITYADRHGQQEIVDLALLPPITFAQNWLIIASAAHLLGVKLDLLVTHAARFSLPAHRLELVGALQHGITFYNDSKATTTMSMLAAVKTVARGASVHLFMGGLSKGVDREPAIAQLSEHVVHIYCFGAEAQTLHSLCQKQGIASSAYTTLEDAFAQCLTLVRPGQSVLLSPGGASYDLFIDYEQRGARFTALVEQCLIKPTV